MVLVVVLDHEGQRYSPQYRAQILSEVLGKCQYEVVVNKDHFGQITREQLAHYEFDVYASGNSDVLKHMDELGYEVQFTDRAYDYEASEDRKLRAIKDAMK